GSASKAPATATFYRVTTQDVHGNESAPTITLDSSNPIPVELTTFDATLDGRTARLTWETASETNNAGFAVERRVDDGAFVEMAFIEGAGTTTTPRRYHYDDRTLPFAARQLTYRLRQVDVAGTVTYSPEVMVGIGRPEQFVLHGPFPNPSRGSVTLRYEVPAAGPVHLAIYDLLGRRIRTLVDARQRAGRQQVQFNAAALPSGVYVVRLTSDGATRTQTITVVR
ncbi:MAG: T9SS type A sorting domain-containing protein, partial [Bacteroidetes bacterium]|nr:T9SS type A sorting domain-containing protein [Bacteroidota bacterium]